MEAVTKNLWDFTPHTKRERQKMKGTDPFISGITNQVGLYTGESLKCLGIEPVLL
jgi:hypothetical protein